MGFIAAHLGGEVSLVIFRHIARYRFGQGAFHRTGFIAADSGGQVFVNGVGHVFGSRVHQVLSRMGNHSFFSGILDIRSSLLGVGLVFPVTSVGIESFIAQVGGGFVISINYSNLSFFCILADGGGLAFDHCFVFHGEGAVIIADHFSGDVLLGAFWFCVIAQVLADFFRPYDGFSCGVYDPFIGSGGDRAAVFIENGFCRVFHTAIGIIDFGCHIAFINLGIVVWFASQGNMFCFELTANFELTLNFHILCGEFVIDFHIISGDIGSTDAPGSLDKTAACIEAFNSCVSCCQVAANFSLASGCQGTGLDISGFHCAGGIDGACTYIQPGAGNLAAFDIAGTYIQLGSGNLAAFDIAGTYIQLLAGDIAIVINSGCTVTDIDATIGIYFETTIGCIDATIGIYFETTIGCIDATIGIYFETTIGYAELSIIANTKFSISCVQSTICFYISGSSIHCEFAAGPFDGTVSIESRFSISRRIAAGKYAIRCNNGTVRAHFDALFVHGNPIISIYVQYQFIHRRGWGAVVSGNFGNHAVVAHFEIILDLLIQLTQGSCIFTYLCGYL